MNPFKVGAAILMLGFVVAIFWANKAPRPTPPRPVVAGASSASPSTVATPATVAPTATPTLLVYCAPSVKPPVEAIARAYELECGVTVQFQFGGSGTLLSGIKVTKLGDVLVAADASYLRLGAVQGLIAEQYPLAVMHPVIGVRADNPKHIATLADLLREDVAVALANPEAASIGRTIKVLLEGDGSWTALAAHAKVFKPTVNDLANDLKLGTVDAALVWDATVRQYPELAAVHTPLLDGASETVSLGVLTCSQQPAAARRFARYLAARDRGLAEFACQHYAPVAGKDWDPAAP